MQLSLRRPVYLLDFACFSAPPTLRGSNGQLIEGLKAAGFSDDYVAAFSEQIEKPFLDVGEFSTLPPGLIADPTKCTLNSCLEETRMVVFPCAESALCAAGITADQVDILITTASTFVTLPSLSAMVANHFKMRTDLQSYSLGGQGCAAGVLSLELANQLLKAMPGKIALVVCTENITAGFSRSELPGCQRSKAIFRVGGAAIVLSSRCKDRCRAKYVLKHSVRVLLTDDEAYNCLSRAEDDMGKSYVKINTKGVLTAAAKAIRTAVTMLAPKILPLSEIVKAALRKDYRPDFGRAFEHILIHTGAGPVISSVAKALGLKEEMAAPSYAAWKRFSNTSVSSTYYVLAHLESKVGVKRGDRILQLGFGSGFKCAAMYWKALRNIDTQHPAWEGDGRGDPEYSARVLKKMREKQFSCSMREP